MKRQVPRQFVFIALLSVLFLPLSGLVYAPTAAAGRAGGPLSEAEVQGLLFMREEEKLARDAYDLLYDRWGLPAFDNISSAEQTHMDALKTLIDRYGLVDPAAHTAAGEFVNAELQALYDALIVQGSTSRTAALAVGALIEEVDILDLQDCLSDVTHTDIAQVYGNLINGSKNHLRAYVGRLEQYGVTYTPVYLDQATFDAIMAGSTGGGRRGHGPGQ